LYDYLYRDSNRIASYYAQIFKGKLSSVEETNSRRESRDSMARASVKLVSGDLKSLVENQNTVKEVFDPHDLTTSDVLSFFAENAWLDEDLAAAPHGGLVISKGTMTFVDRYITEAGIEAIKMMLPEVRKQAKTQEARLELKAQELGIKVLEKLTVPSAFALRTDEGHLAVGTIKDDGMEEPILTYYFKHGTAGLSDVYLIGIKEVPSSKFVLPNTQLLGAGQMAAQGLSDLLFPPDAIRVTPIALFRKL
jgi:hypothetical protein